MIYNKTTIVTVCVAALCLNSCIKPQDYDINSYVMNYVRPSTVELYSLDSIKEEMAPSDCKDIVKEINSERNHIIALYNGPFIENWMFNSKSDDEGDGNSKYDKLCRKHNDLGYNTKVRMSVGEKGTEYQSVDFKTVSITSDSDFDEIHKAGTPLNDIVTFMALSPKKWIDSGYKDTYNWDNYSCSKEFMAIMAYPISKARERVMILSPLIYPINYHYPIEKSAAELNEEDLTLLGCGVRSSKYYNLYFAAFYFTKKPTLSKTHLIKISLTTTEDLEYADTIELNW